MKESYILLKRPTVILWFITTMISRHFTDACHPMCGTGIFHAVGICQQDNRCLCWWGWTGKNAVYIDDGVYRNRILADYCTVQCFYSGFYRNPECASAMRITSTPTVTTAAIINTAKSSTTKKIV